MSYAKGFLAIVVALAVIPAYLRLEPAWRPMVVRLVCAAIVAVGCIRVIGVVRRAMEGEPPSVLDAPPAPPRRPMLDERFLRLRDDIVFSTHRRGYFDAFLWPRLRELGVADRPPAAERRGRRRRGPSLAVIDQLIAEIERRP